MSGPIALEQSGSSVFFSTPARICINEDARTKYASSQTIETLMKELQEKGPLVASGKLGPSAYSDEPIPLKDQMCGQDLYGWKPSAKRVEHPKNSCAIVLGAKKFTDRSLVYFTMSQDITPSTTSYLRTHAPINKKIYVTRHETFCRFLFDLYPPTTASKAFDEKSTPVTPTTRLSSSELEYVKKLSIIPLDSILDRGVVEAQTHAIGQEIFDRYKKEKEGRSLAGQAAAVKICNAVKSIAIDGNLRSQYIERAWDNIGDSTWRWSR